MTTSSLTPEVVAKNAAFDKALHGNTSATSKGWGAMLRKNDEAHGAAAAEYFEHWKTNAKEETKDMREARTEAYADITRQYYNLVTDFYEHGWGQSFHFCRFAYGEPFQQAIARHEHFLASSIGIKKDMKVLDVGCGVGGPARQMVKFTGAHVTGLNINEYQVQRAKMYAQKEGLAHKLDFVQADFMKIPFPDNSFDAVYAIEATCHAPSLKGVYSEILRVLKPGGVFGVYEWLMTEHYDNENVEHRQIRLDIEEGDGIAQMFTIDEGLQAFKDAGFELQSNEDLAETDENPAPWYWTLGTEFKHAQTFSDLITALTMNKYGRDLSHYLLGFLETLRIVPRGSKQTADSLGKAAEALVAGGEKKLFTPMYLMVGKKPLL